MNGEELKQMMKAAEISNGLMAQLMECKIWDVSVYRSGKKMKPAHEQKAKEIFMKDLRTRGMMEEILQREGEEIPDVPVEEPVKQETEKEEPEEQKTKNLNLKPETKKKIAALELLTGVEKMKIISDIVEQNLQAYIESRIR